LGLRKNEAAKTSKKPDRKKVVLEESSSFGLIHKKIHYKIII